jgi:ferric-dicitrate binding protein FerR (iron transport regulator)
VAQETDRQALHLAEVIRFAQDSGLGSEGKNAESKIVARRKASRRRARGRALLTIIAAAAGGILLRQWMKRH